MYDHCTTFQGQIFNLVFIYFILIIFSNDVMKLYWVRNILQSKEGQRIYFQVFLFIPKLSRCTGDAGCEHINNHSLTGTHLHDAWIQFWMHSLLVITYFFNCSFKTFIMARNLRTSAISLSLPFLLYNLPLFPTSWPTVLYLLALPILSLLPFLNSQFLLALSLCYTCSFPPLSCGHIFSPLSSSSLPPSITITLP